MPKRKAIKKSLKIKLFQESAYRCSMCSRFEIDATCLQVCHIEPHHLNQDDELENLIAMCTNCHRVYDDKVVHKLSKSKKEKIAAEKRINQMRSRKLRLMLDSGRYNKIEIDGLFALYRSHQRGLPKSVENSVFIKSVELDGSSFNVGLQGKKNVCYLLSMPRNLLLFFENIINEGLVSVNPPVSRNMHLNGTKPGAPLMFPNHELLITDKGLSFCRRFYTT